jgi:hypothetical protein
MKKTLIGITLLAVLFIQSEWSYGFQDVDKINEMARAQVTIERLRKQKTPDWPAIEQQYAILLPLVQQTDKTKNLNYQEEIAYALAQCSAGHQVKVNQQVLAKGLQHIVVLNIQDELAQAGSSESAAKRIAAYFEGIRPTFVRRDQDFFNARPTLEAGADNAIKTLLNSSQALPLTARRELIDIVDRTYALCVLYEIIKVEKLRDRDAQQCEVKVKEAEVFYRIIQPRIKRSNMRADQTIVRMLGGSYSGMDAGLLETKLNEGLNGITLR